MGRAWLRSAILVGVAVLALTAGPPVTSRVWAQVPPALEGTYEVKEYLLNDEPSLTLKQVMPRLHLLREGVYVWGNFQAPYRTLDHDRVIDLDCRWTGEISLPSRRITFSWTQRELKREHRMLVEHTGRLDVPRERPQAKPCGWKKQSSPLGGWMTASARPVGPLAQTLQAQAPGRVVDGELLLTLRRDFTPDDVRLWMCLVSNGYPRVQFVQPGAAAQEVFVWPDARFRTELRGGVSYEWWLLPSGCETPERQPGGRVPPGPTGPVATEEKVVLACFVSGGRLADCHAWWLTRP